MPAPSLQRTLKTPGLTIHYITSVMGVGILVIPGHAAQIAGPLSLIAWAILIAYSYPFALIFARMSILHPECGGVASFVEKAFGIQYGRMVALFLMFTLIIANPVLGISAARYFNNILPIGSGWPILLVGYLIMVGGILFNLTGLRFSARIQGLILSVLVLCLVSVIILALPKSQWNYLTPFAPQGWSSLGTAIIVVFFAFIGWENAAPVAEEVVAPQQTFKRAILLAVGIVGILYFAMAATVVLVIPPEAGYDQRITVFSTLLQIGIHKQAALFADVIAITLLILTTNAWVLGTSRVVLANARLGLLPRSLTAISRGNAVPKVALLALIPAYGVVIITLMLTGNGEAMLIRASSASFMIIFLITFLSAFRLLKDLNYRLMLCFVIAVTVAFLPFFRESLGYSLILMSLSILLVYGQRFYCNRFQHGPSNNSGKSGDD